VVGTVLAASCGYRGVDAHGPTEAWHVVVTRVSMADALAADEVASGVRDELARAGVLSPGDGWPRVEVEALGVDESSVGIVSVGGGPEARATGVGITARAWLRRAADRPMERDTGDCRAEVVLSVGAAEGSLDPRWAGARRSAALRAGARRLGRELARHVEGLPVTTDEALEP
jgi:hypothetical protein